MKSTTSSGSALVPRTGDDLLELDDRVPVDSRLQVARLGAGLHERVDVDRARPCDNVVVELPCSGIVCADRADECAVLEPGTPQDRLGRSRRGHDDVTAPGLLRRRSRLAAEVATERGEPVGVTRVDDDALERGEGAPKREDVRPRLAPAAEDSEGRRAAPREPRRGDGRSRGGACLSECIGLDGRDDARILDRDQDDEERRAGGRPRVGLQAREAEPPIDARHDGEVAAGDRHPQARRVVDLAARESPKRLLDCGERELRGEQPRDVRLGEVRHRASR